ncbi:hypothetical protein PG995_008970 [Apiospora arundinis]
MLSLPPAITETPLLDQDTGAATVGLSLNRHHPEIPLFPSPLPTPGASADTEEIIRQFQALSRSTKWRLVGKIPFEGDTFEPEGMVRLSSQGDSINNKDADNNNTRYLVSSGEYIVPTEKYPDGVIINGTDRTAGAGLSHLLIYDGQGKRLGDAVLTSSFPGSVAEEYHLGGLDYDGRYLWATASQYRPNTTATLIRVDLSASSSLSEELIVEPLIRIRDHQGGVVHDVSTQTLLTLNWGSRAASLWDLRRHTPPAAPFRSSFAQPRAVVTNPSHYVDYQDCKSLGRPAVYGNRSVMMCSGVAELGPNMTIGGLAIVDVQSMMPLAEVPITLTTELGAPMTKNPMDVALVGGRLRFFFLPNERNSTLYVYEAA